MGRGIWIARDIHRVCRFFFNWWIFGGGITLQRGITPFFLRRHLSSSRINSIWASSDLAVNISSAIIGDCSLSDHIFVTVQWKAKSGCRHCRVWCLNNFLLEMPELNVLVWKDILEFYSLNRGSARTPILWDTCKAFLRGKLIAFKMFRDREKGWVRPHLVSEISRLEKDLKQNPLTHNVKHLQVVYD